MGFNLGEIGDFMFGDVHKAHGTGSFPGSAAVGQDVSTALLDLFRGGESTQFKLGSEALRESVTGFGRAQRQQLGDRALAGGFLDSGVLNQGMGEIDRAELQAWASGIRDLLIAMEDRKFQFALPFLQGAAQENLGVEGLNVQSSVARRGQNQQFASDLMRMLGGPS